MRIKHQLYLSIVIVLIPIFSSLITTSGLLTHVNANDDSNWSMYHHDSTNTRFTSSSCDISNGFYEVYIFDRIEKFAFYGGKVFWYRSPRTTQVLCWDEDTRTVVWEYNIHKTEETLNNNYYPPSYPTIYENRVFVGSYDTIVCLDSDSGELIWKNNDTIVPRGARLGGSLITVYNEKLYVPINYNSNGTLYCLDYSSGDLIWTFTVGAYPKIAVADGRVFLVSKDGTMFILDSETGR